MFLWQVCGPCCRSTFFCCRVRESDQKIILAARALLGMSEMSGLMSFREFLTSADGLNLSGVYPFWLDIADSWDSDVSSWVLTGSLGGGKCILNQRVSTKEGYQYIADLLPAAEDGWHSLGVDVEQPDGGYAVTNGFYKESDASINIIYGSRGVEYSGTDAHPLYVWRRGWGSPRLLRCGELQEGDYVARYVQKELSRTSCSSACVVAYLSGVSLAHSRGGSVDIAFKAKDRAFFWLCGLLEGGCGVVIDNLLVFAISADLGVSVGEALEWLGLQYSISTDDGLYHIVLFEDDGLRLRSWFKEHCSVLDCGWSVKATPGVVVISELLRSLTPSSGVPSSMVDVSLLTIEKKYGVSLDYITRIEKSRGTVYDVSVPSTHLFLSRGVVNHNSSFSNMLICYYLYRVFSSGDLYSYFGIMQGSPIYILYFSVNLKTAERSGFKQLRSMLDSSPWFSRHMPRDKNIESSIRFGNGLSIEFASSESHAIGLNVVGAIIDEANFRRGVGAGLMSEYTEVQQLAQQLEDRLKSRFSRDAGTRMLSLMLYISSASYASSFIEDKMLELRSSSQGRVVRAVQYKICPQNYSSEMFEVFCGYQQIMPCIVQNAAHRETLVKAMGQPLSVCEEYFELVPKDLEKQFKKNIYLAIQNHCGRSTFAKGAFVTNYGVVLQAYDDEVLASRPVGQDSLVVSDQDDIPISSIFDFTSYPYRDRSHALTLDLSLTGDHGSLCCVRYDGRNAEGQHVHTEVFNLDIVPPQFPGMLRISKVEAFLLWLGDWINIAAFSTDAFQSEQLRQNVCESLGLPNVRLSLDSSDIPALMWLSMVVDGRLRLQYLERQDREIREAVHDVAKHRVVKAQGSTDDQFQAMCGAFFLSETVSTRGVDFSDLVGSRLNLVGEGAIRKMLGACGYDTSDMYFSKEDLRWLREQGSSGGEVSCMVDDVVSTAVQRRAIVKSSGEGRKKVSVSELLRQREGCPKEVAVKTSSSSRSRGGLWSLIDVVDKY